MEINTIKNVSFVGAGNVAYNLAPALAAGGVTIRHIISRNRTRAELLASRVNAKASDCIADIDQDTEAVFFTLPDDVIMSQAELLAANKSFKGMMIHTSGSTSLNELLRYSKWAGVFYPLQTFSKALRADFNNIPICVEGGNETITSALENLGRLISTDVRRITSVQRGTIHLGAVFACNFTNHLYAQAFEILRKSGVNPSILLPLIQETAARVQNGEPHQLQTGPALRGDQRILNKHLGMLAGDESTAEIYRLLSEHIQQLKNKKHKHE